MQAKDRFHLKGQTIGDPPNHVLKLIAEILQH